MDEDEVKTQESQELPRWKKMLTERYPDRQFNDDTEVENAFYEDYDATHRKLAQAELDNKRVFELIESNPALADVIVAMGEGVPFEVALAQSVDIEDLLPKEGEPNYEKYTTALAERKKRAEELRSKIASIETNRKQTADVATKFFEEKQLSEEQITGFVDFIDGLIGDIFDGSVSRKTLDKLFQAYKYEEDVQGALEQGEINGRNAKIEAKRETISKTDGLPEPGAAIATQEAPKQKKQIFKI